MEAINGVDLTDLRVAIERANIVTVKYLLSKLTTRQLRQELDRTINGENLVTFATRLGFREIAIELLIRSLVEEDEWSYDYENFSWFKLFEFVDKRESIVKLKEMLKYAEPFAVNGDMDLESLVGKSKFFKVAVLLGARSRDARSLGWRILGSGLSEAKNLFVWLFNRKIFEKIPLTIQGTFMCLRSRHQYFLNLLNDYPAETWIFDCDEKGNNILHWAFQRGARRATFASVMVSLKTIGANDLETITKLAMQKNNAGEVPAVLFFLRKNRKDPYPPEFVQALKRLIETDQTEPLREFFTHHAHGLEHLKSRAMLFFHLLQIGFHYKTMRDWLWTATGVRDFHQIFHKIDKKLPNKERKQKNGTENEDGFAFLDLPKELHYIILGDIEPRDLVTLFSSSKYLQQMFKQLSNSEEKFWQSYYQEHFNPTMKHLQTTYRSAVMNRLRLNSKWSQNTYSEIDFSGKKFTPLHMDENWLLLSNNNKYCYWDCQNQQLTNTSVEYHTNRQHVLIDNYNRDAGSTTLTIGQQAWSIIRGEQVTDLTNVSQELKNGYAAGEVVPIDHRIMFSYWYTNLLYDLEIDQVVYEFSPQREKIMYNPYNHMFYSHQPSETCKMAVIDIRSNQTTPYECPDFECTSRDRYTFVDEHTLFYTTQPYSRADQARFVDVRTFKAICTVDNIVPMHQNEVYSKERVIFKGYTIPMLYSWHLPSRKIEWIECTTRDNFVPLFANSRYIVTAEHAYHDGDQNIVIRDYMN